MESASDAFFVVGVITGVHGLRGDLKVLPHSGDPAALLATERVRLILKGRPEQEFRVAVSRLHKGRVLLRLQGLADIQAVEGWVGAEVWSPYAELDELDEGEFYWHQLEGLTVVDRRLGELGVLSAYLETAGHDTWVVQGRFGEVLIPAVDAFIEAIEPAAGRIDVSLPEGLVELNAD